MVVLIGRVLSPPTLLFGDNKSFTPIKASWNLKGRKLFEPKDLSHWTYLVVGSAVFNTQHLAELRKQISACGMGDARPLQLTNSSVPLRINDDKCNDRNMHLILQLIKNAGGRYVFVVLKKHDRDIYSCVKRAGDVVVGKSALRSIICNG